MPCLPHPWLHTPLPVHRYAIGRGLQPARRWRDRFTKQDSHQKEKPEVLLTELDYNTLQRAAEKRTWGGVSL